MNTTINTENYLEWFCSYADNELSETQRQDVLRFVHENPIVLPEFEAIQMTIVTPEKHVADFKNELYKKENVVAFVPSARRNTWIKIASLAATLLLSVGLFVTLNNSKKPTSAMATNAPVKTNTTLREDTVAILKNPILQNNPVLEEMNAFAKGKTTLAPQTEMLETVITTNIIEDKKPLLLIEKNNTQRNYISTIASIERKNNFIQKEEIQLKEIALPISQIQVVKNYTLLNRIEQKIIDYEIFQSIKEDATTKYNTIKNSNTAMALANNPNTTSLVKKVKSSPLFQSVSDDFSGKYNRIRDGLKQVGITH
jgi:hypothetical protein